MASRRPSKLRYRSQYEAFRCKLVEARYRAGLTQRDVAKQISKSPSYVAKCETGERRVDLVELAQFCVVYKKPLSYFAPFLKRG